MDGPRYDRRMSEDGAKYASRPFRRVRTEFSVDQGRAVRGPGYRPLWRIARAGSEPLLLGMCELKTVEGGEIQPGETRVAEWEFWAGVQGYVEEFLKPGDVAAICDGGTAIGQARVVEFVY